MQNRIRVFVVISMFGAQFFSNFGADLNREERIRRHFLSPEVDTLPISDWFNPTFEDYKLLQVHLKKKLVSLIDSPVASRCFENDHLNSTLHNCIVYRLGRLKFIDTEDNMPSYNTIYFNNDPQKKDKCVVCYAGYLMPGAPDRDYPRGIHFIIEALKASGFDGHFIYRVGGWPNLRKERLKFIDAPYSFKPFFLEEIRELGYKKVLWLDTACIPVRSLNPIFDIIETQGCCFFSGGEVAMQDLIERGYVMASMGISQISKQSMSIISQVIGLNFENDSALLLLDLWIKAAEKKVPFLEPSGDQFSFSLLANELNLLSGKLPNSYYMEGRSRDFTGWKLNKDCIIYHLYDFLDSERPAPQNIFD